MEQQTLIVVLLLVLAVEVATVVYLYQKQIIYPRESAINAYTFVQEWPNPSKQAICDYSRIINEQRKGCPDISTVANDSANNRI